MITGNEAAAWGARLARVKVVSAYPITPQTKVVEKIAEFIANGEMDARYIRVESEHSAMAACISAENTGVRTFTATSAHGLALMHEMLMWAAYARLPIVMAVINRAMAPPWSIWADHQDSMAQRDTGWIQIYSESNQEELDAVLMLYKICEDKDVLLPAMTMMDAFILSHTMEPVDIPDQKLVDDFLPELDLPHRLDINRPAGHGSLIMPEGPVMEYRKAMADAFAGVRDKILKVEEEFREIFGREYGGLVEEYRTEDADAIAVVSSTIASTSKEVVDRMRERGLKVGLARVRYFRPFPHRELREIAKKTDMLGVIDRSYTFGYGGALYAETKGVLYGHSDIPVKNYIMGIGGRDVTPEILEKVFMDMLKIAKDGAVDTEVEWVGLIGDERWSA
jgi:2-oxoisovalerate ferredoxin oxidoreductase alpha subunit